MMLRHWEAVQKNWNGISFWRFRNQTSLSSEGKKKKDFLNSCLRKHTAVNPLSIHLSFELKQRRKKIFLQINFNPVMKALQLKSNASAQQNILYLDPVKPVQNTVPLFMLPTRATTACSSCSTQRRPRSFAVARKAAPGAGLWAAAVRRSHTGAVATWATEQVICWTRHLILQWDTTGKHHPGKCTNQTWQAPSPSHLNSCSIFQSFPSTLSMWAQAEGIRVGSLELISRGAAPGSWHPLSLISTASWDRPCHCCAQGYPRLCFLSPCSLLAECHPTLTVTPPLQLHSVT